MCKNELVEEFKKTLTRSLFKSGKICGIDESIIRNAYEQVRDEIDKGISLIDVACDKFSKCVLINTSRELKEEKIPEGLELVFSGKNGGKLYQQDCANAPLVTNDFFLLDRDLRDLSKSFYPDDYLEAKNFHDAILQLGLISLKEYLQK